MVIKQNKKGAIILTFMQRKAEQPMADKAQTQETDTPLSLFDVKELYDRAYAEKKNGNEDSFKSALSEAVKMDMVYRHQLRQSALYKDPEQKNNFQTATKKTKSA